MNYDAVLKYMIAHIIFFLRNPGVIWYTAKDFLQILSELIGKFYSETGSVIL